MPARQVLKGMGLLIGMIVGAGMFALPYTVFQAGLFASSFQLVLVVILVSIVHLLYGAIFYKHYEHHRLPGLIGEYLGTSAYAIALAARFFTYFGTLLIYGVLGGLFLSYIIPSISSSTLSIIFFIAFIPVLGDTVRKAGTFNLYLTVPLIAFVLLLFAVLIGSIETLHIIPYRGSGAWFLPYGVFLFAFGGASVIPEVVDTFRAKSKGIFKLTVLGSIGVVTVLYILFVVTVLGVVDGTVTEDAIWALQKFAGHGVFLLAALIGLFAVASSYFALALELRYTLQYDVLQKKYYAWVLTALVPLLLFFGGVNNFLEIIAIVGSVGVGIEGLFIVLLARKTLKTNIVLVAVLSTLFMSGAVFGVFDAIGII